MKIQKFESLSLLTETLKSEGCKACSLGKQSQPHGPVLFRGNQEARMMVIGESPGSKEVGSGRPFMGPPGALLDRIFKSVELDLERDFYMTNTVLCRAVPPWGVKRQNLPSPTEAVETCRTYLKQQIELLDPRVVVLVGRPACFTVLRTPESMFDLVGKVQTTSEWPEVKFFPLYHPSYILRNEKNPEKYEWLRNKTWEHIQVLKEVINEEGDRCLTTIN